MAFTLFYAWQMDRHKNVCRWFIHRAAEDAIKAVLADLKLEDAPGVEAGEQNDQDPEVSAAPEIQLDHDIKGEITSSLIAETILGKIQRCGIFLADVSLVGETTTEDGRKKKVPNANVMLELGAAIASVGWNQIILVMNTAFGSPDELPFDLKYRTVRVTYHLDRHDHPERAKKRRELVKQLAEIIKAMQQRGVWTKQREEEQLAAEEKMRGEKETERKATEAADGERTEFDRQLATNEFLSFRGRRAIVGVFIRPLFAPECRMSLDDDFARRNLQFVAPFPSGFCAYL